MATIKLAEALLRRKELQEKVGVLKQFDVRQLFEVKVTRKAAHEGIDDIMAQVPKLKPEDVTRNFDWHAKQLRRIDAAIQQTNWTATVDVPDEVMQDFKE